jgi:ethanolamine utilization protein EutQ (cupin superfamily)
MEVQPGFFVSSLTTDAWEPDLEVGGEMHVLCSGVGIEAGLSRFGEDSDPVVVWTLPDRETLLVLEGKARIEVKGGPTLELKAGDMASLPKGAQTTWHLTLPFREFWVLGSGAGPT